MTHAVTLRCPKCKLQLEAHAWHDDSSGECRRCGTSFEFIGFPALTAEAARIAPHAAEVSADSACFFHAQNRAESICERCGRLLCTVCSVPFMGQKLCPVCIATATKQESAPVTVRDRVLFDSLALTVAVLPMLLFPITLVTAPVALGLVFVGWNKPGSLVRGRGRWRFILAVLVAVAQIVAWLMVFNRNPQGRH